MEENIQAQDNKSRAVWILIITLLIILVLLFYILKDMEKVRVFIGGSGWIGLLVSVGIYGLLGASPVPSEPLTILISVIFGPLNATLVAGTGNLLAALIEYFIGSKIGDASTFARRKEKLPFGLGKFPVNSPIFLIAARMIPGYGPKFVSLVSGLYQVPLLLYLWTSAIPTFLGAAIFAYGGFGLLLLRMKSWY
ncbi:MAG: VTT domain-containing protein [Chloroflexi bacterium]|nr:VTT domain-containing protein [Chloroflexota bacterium]